MHEGPLLLPSGHVLFTPPREFDLAAAPDVASELESLLEMHPFLAVDLSAMEFLDSSGIGVLMAAHRMAQAFGGEIVLCGTSAPVERLFGLTGLEDLFTRYPDTESVLPWSRKKDDAADARGSVEGVG